MSVAFVLLIILLFLMAVIGRKRGVKSFFTLFLNFITLFLMLIFIAIGFNPIKVTIISCIIITSFSLFYINGVNKKTVSSLVSVIIVVFLTIIIVYKLGINSNIQGFGNEQAESVSYLSLYVGIDFTQIVICEALIGLLGAIIDVSISISSSLNEMYKNNTAITVKNLFKSGLNIGRDILGTMTNTMFFAYLSEFMTLIIYFNQLHYSILSVINAKVFCSEMFQILCSGIGIILIIPVTAYIASNIITLKPKQN